MATPPPEKPLAREILSNSFLKGLLKPEKMSLRRLMLSLSTSIQQQDNPKDFQASGEKMSLFSYIGTLLHRKYSNTVLLSFFNFFFTDQIFGKRRQKEKCLNCALAWKDWELFQRFLFHIALSFSELAFLLNFLFYLLIKRMCQKSNVVY